jgi:hypothetical protein
MGSHPSFTEPPPRKPRPCARLPFLALASLATFIEHAGAQAKLNQDDLEAARREAVAVQMAELQQLFDRLVFQQDGNMAGARRRLTTLLTSQVQELDRLCRLTDAQRQKLHLAGRGDVHRFFARYEAAKQKAFSLPPEVQNVRTIQQEASALRTILQSGLFHEASLLQKSLPNTLTDEQFARYDAMERERRAARHRTTIEQALNTLQRSVALREPQRRALLALLTQEIKPFRRSSRYDQYRILIQLDRLPEEKLKPLFDGPRWAALEKQLLQYRDIERQLKDAGVWPEEDDEADRVEAGPAVLKR